MPASTGAPASCIVVGALPPLPVLVLGIIIAPRPPLPLIIAVVPPLPLTPDDVAPPLPVCMPAGGMLVVVPPVPDAAPLSGTPSFPESAPHAAKQSHAAHASTTDVRSNPLGMRG